MRKTYWRIAAVAMLAGGLSACGSSNSTAPVTPPVVVPPAPKLEDQFGTNFGIAYRGSITAEATDPKAGDIIPLSLTTEPVAL